MATCQILPSCLRQRRNPRHLLLVIFLPISALINVAKTTILVAAAVSIAITVLDVDSVRHLAKGILGLQVTLTVVSYVQVTQFIVFWPRKHRTYRRSVAVVLGDVISLILTFSLLSRTQWLRHIVPKEGDSILNFPDLSIFVAVLGCLDAGIHLSAVLLWVWLLPPALRLPNSYEPVLDGKRGRDAIEAIDPQMALIQDPNEPSEDLPLEILFRKHERMRQSSLNNPSNERAQQRTANVVSFIPTAPSISQRRQSGNKSVPRLPPAIKHWAIGYLATEDFTYSTNTPFYIVLFAIVFETINFVVILGLRLPCPWPCYLGFAYMLIESIVVVIPIILSRLRKPLDYKLLSHLRMDMLIWIAFFVCCGAGTVLHILRFLSLTACTKLLNLEAQQEIAFENNRRSYAAGSIVLFSVHFVVTTFMLSVTLRNRHND